jgi:hypothetical protein
MSKADSPSKFMSPQAQLDSVTLEFLMNSMNLEGESALLMLHAVKYAPLMNNTFSPYFLSDYS